MFAVFLCLQNFVIVVSNKSVLSTPGVSGSGIHRQARGHSVFDIVCTSLGTCWSGVRLAVFFSDSLVHFRSSIHISGCLPIWEIPSTRMCLETVDSTSDQQHVWDRPQIHVDLFAFYKSVTTNIYLPPFGPGWKLVLLSVSVGGECLLVVFPYSPARLSFGQIWSRTLRSDSHRAAWANKTLVCHSTHFSVRVQYYCFLTV